MSVVDRAARRGGVAHFHLHCLRFLQVSGPDWDYHDVLCHPVCILFVQIAVMRTPFSGGCRSYG